MNNDFRLMLSQARSVIITVGVLTGIVVFLWSLRLWGFSAACLSLCLYCLSPTILSHTRLATSDIVVTLGFLLSTGMIWQLTHRVSVLNIVLTGLALAVLALSKMSAIIIAPYVVVILLIRYYYGPRPVIDLPVRKLPATPVYLFSLLAVLIIMLGIIHLAYLSDPAELTRSRDIIPELPFLLQLPLGIIQQFHLLPESYLHGLAFTLSRTETRLSFAMGQYSLSGWWWFFPVVFILKTPLVTLVTGLLAVTRYYSLSKHEQGNSQQANDLYQALPLAVFIVIYLLIAIISHLNIGHRHLLPVYPPLFILLGIVAYRTISHRNLYALLICSLLAIESLSIHPHYLAFINRAAGGPANGYKLLVDSSLDWGQDLPSLAKWLEGREKENTYIAYFGTDKPENYHITSRTLPGFLDRGYVPDIQPLQPGRYIISATLLQLVFQPPEAYGPWGIDQEKLFQNLSAKYGHNAQKVDPSRLNPEEYARYERLRFGRLCHYLRSQDPREQIGYSLLIYEMNESDLQAALFSPLYSGQHAQ